MAGIYVHIPFCKQRCIYCDFYSTSLHALIDDYVDAVITEASMRPCNGVSTVYLGGGTPSQLSCSQISRLIMGLRSVYDMDSLEEFTVEVNPDDVTKEYIDLLKSMGVNRISMGVQSFVDAELVTINRRHDADGAIKAVEVIRDSGIDNVSIDLIYGIPGQTMKSWEASIATALKLMPEHLSAYNLSYEHGTKLWQMRERGELKETDEETCVEMYKLLSGMLKNAGYNHYEISNYCLPGFHSRHNSSYWDGTPYVGLGASAHSYDGSLRSYNCPSVKEYIKEIKANRRPATTETLEWWEKYDEVIMVALRTSRGLDLKKISSEFGESKLDYLLSCSRKYIDNGMLLLKDDFLQVSEDAFMMSDAIIRDLMWDE